MLLRLYQPVGSPVSVLKEGKRNERRKKREAKPGFKSLDHLALEGKCLHMLCRPGRKSWAFHVQLEARPNGMLSGPHAFHMKQLPLIARTNWGDASHQQGLSITSIQLERRKKLRTDQLGLPTINRRIRFDTLAMKTCSFWKVGHNGIKNYKRAIWMTMRGASTWPLLSYT